MELRASLESRLNLAVGLSLRGKSHFQLPRFYVRIGQALHALQDGFTHTYRDEARTQVSVTLNYVDVVNRDYLANRDGPKHSMELDRCDAPDALRTRNRQLAVEASAAVLSAALAPAMSREQKLAALTLVLDKYLSHQPGCTAANEWCIAAEAFLSSGGGCTSGGGWSGLLGAGLVLLVLARKQRVVRGLLLLLLTVPLNAKAQELPPIDPSPAIDSKEATTEGTTVPITASEVKAEQKEVKHRSIVSLYLGGSGSLYNAAVAGAVGIRFRLSDYWHLGVDAELNGWYGIHARHMRTGATNIYASVVFRLPLKFQHINLRSNAQLGAAVQMFDLVGVPAGSVGLFAGINPLGVEFKLTGHLFLIFYPLGFAAPVTQLKGAPFAFHQFRTTLGLEATF